MQPMQNQRKTARLADLVVAPSTSLSSTANHVSIPITGAPTDQRTAHCKGKEKREECDLQLIRPASRHCALIVHSPCILVTLCVILCVFTQLILSHFDLEVIHWNTHKNCSLFFFFFRFALCLGFLGILLCKLTLHGSLGFSVFRPVVSK